MQKKLVAGIAGVAMAATTGIGMTQLAQAETPTPTPTTGTSASSTPGGDTAPTERRMASRGHPGNGFDVTALANKLGLPEDAVSEALTTVRDQSGVNRPTFGAPQAEKDAAKEARHAELVTALAAELNIDEATVSSALTELQSERASVKSADQKAILDQAVNDGILTRAEADAVQKAADAGIASLRGGGPGRR